MAQKQFKKKRKRYRLLATSFFYNWNGININWGISHKKLLLDGNKQKFSFHVMYTSFIHEPQVIIQYNLLSKCYFSRMILAHSQRFYWNATFH